MKLKTKRQVPAHEEEFVVGVKCDMCGHEHKGSYIPGNWADGTYETDRVEISHEEGEHYPEGAQGQKLVLDICPACFKNKFIPWMKTQGVEIKYEPYNY